MKEVERRLRQSGRTRAIVHDERMKKIAEKPIPELKPQYNRAGEAEIVPGYQLSVVLRKWIVDYLAERPRHHYGADTNGFSSNPDFMGPIDWLAEKTGIHVRKVSAICNGEVTCVSLTKADALLTAIDQYDLLSKGEIQILPNPNWSMEDWIAYRQERGCA